MPPIRNDRQSRSRSQSISAAPLRPGSSHSTTSLRSGHTTEAGAPYPQHRNIPRLAASQAPRERMASPEHQAMIARMLQAENAQISQSQLQAQMMEAAAGMHNNQPMQQHMQQTIYHQPVSVSGFSTPELGYSFQLPHSQMISQLQPVYAEQIPVILETRRPRASTGQTNENELKDMLERNNAKSLEEVAGDVRATDRTSTAEKTKQLFAMLWLKENLIVAKTSVPRIRVHTQYAARCARLHLQPLNQASFGKLVRVIFPDIQTRRLGVRGESKYHYVDLALVDDKKEGVTDITSRQSASNIKRAGAPANRSSLSLNSETIRRFEPDSALIPNHLNHSPVVDSPTMATMTSSDAEVRIFPSPQEPKFTPSSPTAARSYRQKMKFSSTPIMRVIDTDEIDIPNIDDYAPAKWDRDIKDALYTAYHSHVISIIDNVRYCKEKGFFRLITAFQGTMTVPVQKLFVHEDIAPWIKACDFLMYQKIIRFLAPLTLQVIPPKVMKFLHSVSKLLYNHIITTFSGIPKYTLDAKLEPATVFCQLLERLIRSNQTAHAASAVLIDDTNRQRMWAEYVELVQPKSMMSAFIPDCGYDEDVYRLLTHDVRNLLLPLRMDPGLEVGTHYQEAAEIQNSLPQPDSFELDKFGDFVENLRARFPTAPSRDLLHYIQGVTSYILRDVIMENGQSYNCWLVVKCFVDELALWLIHAGGFLEYNPLPHLQEATLSANGTNGISNAVSNGSRGSSLSRQNSTAGTDGNATQTGSLPTTNNLSGPGSAQYSTSLLGSKPLQQADSPIDDTNAMSQSKDVDMDDSGIGLSLIYEANDLAKQTLNSHLEDISNNDIDMSGVLHDIAAS